MDLETELRHLESIERYIAEAQERIAHLEGLAASLSEGDQDQVEAPQTLRDIRASLAELKAQREVVKRTIADIRQGLL